MKKRIAWTLVAMLALYLLAWPVPIRPVAWDAPPAPALGEGIYARDDGLRAVQRIADGAVQGPEAIAFDAQGRLYTGLADGRIVSMNPDGADCRVLGNTGGRPLGVYAQDDGGVLVADARKGLLRLAPGGQVETLSTQADVGPLGFTDDLVVDERGRVLFTDASWKFGYGQHLLDVLEHGARGRLLMYDPEKRLTATLLPGLNFANGVALGPEGNYVLINESSAYRITRYWLKGERAGTSEVFADNLPGFPDNLSFNGRDRFWVALFSPRDAMLDALAPHPFWRSVLARLPPVLLPGEKRQGFILGLDLNGQVVEQYRYAGAGAYGPITSVREHRGALYLGSLSQSAIGRVPLSVLSSGEASQPPPAPLSATCD